MGSLSKQFYRFLVNFPLTMPIMVNMSYIHQWKYPGCDALSQRSCIRYVLRNAIEMMAFLVIALKVWDYGAFTVLLILIGVFIIASFNRHLFISKSYTQILEELEPFLDRTRNIFQCTGEMKETLEEAMYESPILIACHMKQLISVLEEEDVQQLQLYKDSVASPYLLSFSIISRISNVYGDTITKHSSTFLSAINCLKQEVHMELLHRNKVKHVFSGLVFVAVFPLLFLDIIKNWSVFNLPELSVFYHGINGLLCRVVICIITVGVFRLLLYLKEPVTLVKKKYYLLDFLLSRRNILSIVLAQMQRKRKYWLSMQRYLRKFHSALSIPQFILLKWIYAIASSMAGLFLFLVLKFYKGVSSPFSLAVVFFSVLIITIGMYKLPEVIVAIKLLCLGRELDEELMRLQAVLIMVSAIDRMMLESILEWLSQASIVYQEEFMYCLDSYREDSEVSLEQLKKKVDQPSFEYIIDNLIGCDRIGIKKAFEDLPSEYSYCFEKCRQQNTIRLDNQSAIGRVVAYLPLIVVIGCYLIIPFVTESISQFYKLVKQIRIF